MSCIELSGHYSPKIIYSNNYAVNGSITLTGIDYSGISFVNTPYINVRTTGFFTELMLFKCRDIGRKYLFEQLCRQREATHINTKNDLVIYGTVIEQIGIQK